MEPTAPRHQVRVRDFGGLPEATDNTLAIRSALAAAKRRPGSDVVFEPGVYHVQGQEPGWRISGNVSYHAPIFDLNGLQDVRVLGNGAVLQARNWAITFRVSDTAGIEFHDLTVDWARDLPHTEGVVVNDTPGYVDVHVNDGFASREGLHAFSFIHYSLERQRLEPPIVYQPRFDVPEQAPQTCHPLSDTVLRCHKSEHASNTRFPLHDGIIIDHAISTVGSAFVVVGSSEVSWMRTTIHAAPGTAIKVGDIRNCSIKNTTVAPPPGRWKSTTRDASSSLHVSGRLSIDGLEVVRSGDDAYNFRGLYYSGKVHGDRTTIVIQEWANAGPHGDFEDSYRYAPLHTGDVVELTMPDKPMVVFATASLRQVDKSVSTDIDGQLKNTYVLVLDERLQPGIRDVFVFNSSRMPERAELVNSRIINPRGGGRLRTDHTTLRNNLFTATTGVPVPITAELTGINSGHPVIEGTTANDVTIEGNVFDDTNLSDPSGVISTGTGGMPDAPPGTFRNVAIVDNSFVNVRSPVPGICLQSASNIEVAGNDFGTMDAERRVVLRGNNHTATIHVES